MNEHLVGKNRIQLRTQQTHTQIHNTKTTVNAINISRNLIYFLERSFKIDWNLNDENPCTNKMHHFH